MSKSRDYTYINNIIDGIIQSIESDDRYMIYNLGNSKPIKLSNLISIIVETIGINRAKDNLKHYQDGISAFVKWNLSMKNTYEVLY
jgi:UDP-glucuronate 4-epimerase